MRRPCWVLLVFVALYSRNRFVYRPPWNLAMFTAAHFHFKVVIISMMSWIFVLRIYLFGIPCVVLNLNSDFCMSGWALLRMVATEEHIRHTVSLDTLGYRFLVHDWAFQRLARLAVVLFVPHTSNMHVFVYITVYICVVAHYEICHY